MDDEYEITPLDDDNDFDDFDTGLFDGDSDDDNDLPSIDW